METWIYVGEPAEANFAFSGLIPRSRMFKNSQPRIKFAVIIMKFTLLCITLIIDTELCLELLIEYSRVALSLRALARSRGECDRGAPNLRLLRMQFFGARSRRSTLIRSHRGDFAGHRAI